jgi:hypothetical protein
MKVFLSLVAAATLMLAFDLNNVSAATIDTVAVQSSDVPDADLAQFGLGGMQRVSDKDGLQVRGKFRLPRIHIVQINRNKPVVNNIYLSHPLQIFSLLR